MKSHSFSKKLLSLFLAIIMALSCCTAAFSAFAASSNTENELYEAQNKYNSLGWIQTTDEQKLSAVLDYLDGILANSGIKQVIDITVAKINIDLTSVNGLLATVDSVDQTLGGLGGLLGGDVKKINLKGVHKGYAESGNNGPVMTRENSTSVEIVRGLLNLVFMNTNSYAANSVGGGAFTGGNVIQSVLNGTLSLGGLQGTIEKLIGGPIYNVIANAAGFPVGWEKNAVNNILLSMLKTNLADGLATKNPEIVNTLKTDSNGSFYFESKAGKRLSLEEWGADVLNKELIPGFVNVDSKPVFAKGEFEVNVNDPVMAQLFKAVNPILKNSLVPLFGKISVDFFHIPQITRMYTDWKMAQKGFKAPTTKGELDALWSAASIKNWISEDATNIAAYLTNLKDWDGNALCGKVEANPAAVETALKNIFNSLDRDTKDIDVAYLFTNMLYSPVAVALGCDTGVLNLNVRDYYFGNYGAFFDMKAVKGNVLDTVYPVVTEFLKALVPGFTAWETAATNETVDGLADKFVKTAGKMIEYVADGSNKAILRDFHTNHPGAALDETTIEEAITPLLISFVYHGKTFSNIHASTWNQVKDLNGFIFVLLEEYLKETLPEFNYRGLVQVTDGKLVVDLEKALLPMARDCVAVVVQGIVPLNWDVYTKGGVQSNGQLRDNKTVFDLANEVLCFFADDLKIAPLLGFTEFAVKGSGSAEKSGINRSNDIWTNVDILINKALPAFSSLFAAEEGKFNSKDFFYTTILNGVLNMEEVNNSVYGHAKKGFGALLYNLIYLVTESAPLNQTSAVKVVYDVIRNSANTVLGARNDGDKFGDFLPANTGVQPFTDLLQNKVMSGGKIAPSSACAAVNADGVIGILFGRLAENSGAGNLCRKVADTVLPGALNVLYSVNAGFKFIPTLANNTLKAATASFDTSSFVIGNDFSNKINVTNNANGLKRYIDNGKLTERYYINVTNIECINDTDAYVDIIDPIIAPGKTASFETGEPIDPGAKDFKVEYQIVDKNGSPYEGIGDKTFTTYASYNYTDAVSWFEELYNPANGQFKNEFKINNNNVKDRKYTDGTVATRRTEFFGDSTDGAAIHHPYHMAFNYPDTIVIDNRSIPTLSNTKIGLFNKDDKFGATRGWLDALYVVDGKISDGKTEKMTPSFDAAGNILNWTVKEASGKPQIAYTAEQAKKLPGYEATHDSQGNCTGIKVNYDKEVYRKITLATPVPGTYVKGPIDVYCGKGAYDAYSWIYPTGESIPGGNYTINLMIAAPKTDSGNKYFSINVKVADSTKLPALQQLINEATDYVNNHSPEEFNDLTSLETLADKIAESRAVSDAFITRKNVDTLPSEIQASIDALNAQLKATKADLNETKSAAVKVANEVIKDFEARGMYDYENVAYNLTRNAYFEARSFVKAELKDPVIHKVTSTDKDFNKLGKYQLVAKDGSIVDEGLYTTLVLKISNGSYDARYGINKNSKEGTDYRFQWLEGKIDPETGKVMYNYSNNAPVVQIEEAVRIYNAYKAVLDTKVRAYADNDNALMNEILCATGAEFKGADDTLKKFIGENIKVQGENVMLTAGITPKYGKLEGTTLVNKGATVYTDDSWNAYIAALKAAINGVSAANGKVSELQALRVNVMNAENALTPVAVKDVTYTYTFADGHTQTVVAAEGTTPQAPTNTAATFKSNNDKTHTKTTYTWPEFAQGTTSYTEVKNTVTEACQYETVKTEPTRGENGKITHKCSLCGHSYEEIIPALGVTVTVDSAKLGTVTISATGVDNKPVNGDAAKNTVKYKSEYTLTAKANANAKFVGWYSGNKLISTQETYKTNAYADTTYTPVFQEVTGNEFTVTFMGYYGNIVKTVSSTELASLTKLPDSPGNYVGLKFTGWSMTLEEVKALKESTVVYSKYVKDDTDTFTITANGCNIDVDGVVTQNTATLVKYNSKVTVTPVNGKATSWSVDGKVVAYGESYSFYCGADATITFATDVVAEEKAVVSIVDTTQIGDTYRVTFLSSHSVPEKYEVVESGFVYGMAMSEEDLVLENVGTAQGQKGKTVKQIKSNTPANVGQFRLTYGVTSMSADACARAYVIYKDAQTQETFVEYSAASIFSYPAK